MSCFFCAMCYCKCSDHATDAARCSSILTKVQSERVKSDSVVKKVAITQHRQTGRQIASPSCFHYIALYGRYNKVACGSARRLAREVLTKRATNLLQTLSLAGIITLALCTALKHSQP